MNAGLLDSGFSLAKCRVLWELAQAEAATGITATALGRLLDLDAGYLSRLLGALKEQGLVKATRSKGDARQSLLQLTAAGRRAFAPLDRRSRHQVGELLARLTDEQQADLLRALQRVQLLLDDPQTKTARHSSIILRPHRPGDMGWLVSRHGALYARDYQWDMRVGRDPGNFLQKVN